MSLKKLYQTKKLAERKGDLKEESEFKKNFTKPRKLLKEKVISKKKVNLQKKLHQTKKVAERKGDLKEESEF